MEKSRQPFDRRTFVVNVLISLVSWVEVGIAINLFSGSDELSDKSRPDQEESYRVFLFEVFYSISTFGAFIQWARLQSWPDREVVWTVALWYPVVAWFCFVYELNSKHEHRFIMMTLPFVAGLFEPATRPVARMLRCFVFSSSYYQPDDQEIEDEERDKSANPTRVYLRDGYSWKHVLAISLCFLSNLTWTLIAASGGLRGDSSESMAPSKAVYTLSMFICPTVHWFLSLYSCDMIGYSGRFGGLFLFTYSFLSHLGWLVFHMPELCETDMMPLEQTSNFAHLFSLMILSYASMTFEVFAFSRFSAWIDTDQWLEVMPGWEEQDIEAQKRFVQICVNWLGSNSDPAFRQEDTELGTNITKFDARSEKLNYKETPDQKETQS